LSKFPINFTCIDCNQFKIQKILTISYLHKKSKKIVVINCIEIKNMSIQIQKIAVVLMIVVYILSAAAATVSAVSTPTEYGRTDEKVSHPHFDRSTFAIIRGDGTRFSFKAKVAASGKAQAYGLMFVRSMPDDQGMIFLSASPKPVTFWMKNTLIPLDILFVRPDGVLSWIKAEARPQDETPIYSQGPVSAVIEINGGLAKKYGLSAGDKVKSPAIKVQ
jgi:uncharacterized membrane protein (UPF0127 family)